MRVKVVGNYLTIKDLQRELLKRDIEVAHRTLLNYIHKGYIPEEFVIVKRKGRRRFYLLRPEVVDYLVEKLLDEDFRDWVKGQRSSH